MHPICSLFSFSQLFEGRGSWPASGKVVSFFLASGMLAFAGTGCVSAGKRAEGRIPVVKLSQTPSAVQTAIVSAAQGRRIQKINRVRQLEGPVFRAYICDQGGLRLLTVDSQGTVLDDAVVIPLAEMPPAVQAAARTAVSGQLQVCRISLHRPQPTYLIDYLLGEDEPVFAVIEADGFVRAVIGYAEEDPD